jgi:tRNA (adenine58-N1)-methyltransferase non-catalytic subunit
MQDILMITMKLWDYLRNSGCLVVYSREIEYLVALEKLIFDNKYAIDVRIHETYLREYQVLSQRTHPMMNNKGFSGYVLSAIKVNNK